MGWELFLPKSAVLLILVSTVYLCADALTPRNYVLISPPRFSLLPIEYWTRDQTVYRVSRKTYNPGDLTRT